MLRDEDGRILVVDVGSTAVKAAVVDFEARILSTGSAAQRTVGRAAYEREHEPAATWRAVRAAIRSALAKSNHPNAIRAISVTGPRGSFCIVDRAGRPTTNMVTWQDGRASLLEASPANDPGPDYRAVSGVSFDGSAVLPKLLVMRSAPSSAGSSAFPIGWQLATPQGLVLARLGSDDQVVDLSTAAHVGLLDLARLTWSDDLLARFEVPRSALPRLVAPGAIVGRLDRAVAEGFGLPPGLPLIAAGSDGVCSELGAGVVAIGQLYAYLGTAAAVAGPVGSPAMPSDSSLIVMPGSTSDAWRLLGLALAGGGAREWIMTSLGIRSQARIDKLIRESRSGSGGVLFIPTLAGASAPVPDGRARAIFVGLSLKTGTGDLVRAVHEGVALEIRALIEAMRETLPRPVEVRMTGGGSRSDEWMQVVANVLGVPVSRVREPNPGLRGAAMYALSSFGRFPDVRAAARSFEPEVDRFEPDLDCGILYQEAAQIYATIRQLFRSGGVDGRLFSLASLTPDAGAS
jgi:xylulokinase